MFGNNNVSPQLSAQKVYLWLVVVTAQKRNQA